MISRKRKNEKNETGNSNVGFIETVHLQILKRKSRRLKH